jgi:hypothetical protein
MITLFAWPLQIELPSYLRSLLPTGKAQQLGQTDHSSQDMDWQQDDDDHQQQWEQPEEQASPAAVPLMVQQQVRHQEQQQQQQTQIIIDTSHLWPDEAADVVMADDAAPQPAASRQAVGQRMQALPTQAVGQRMPDLDGLAFDGDDIVVLCQDGQQPLQQRHAQNQAQHSRQQQQQHSLSQLLPDPQPQDLLRGQVIFSNQQLQQGMDPQQHQHANTHASGSGGPSAGQLKRPVFARRPAARQQQHDDDDMQVDHAAAAAEADAPVGNEDQAETAVPAAAAAAAAAAAGGAPAGVDAAVPAQQQRRVPAIGQRQAKYRMLADALQKQVEAEEQRQQQEQQAVQEQAALQQQEQHEAAGPDAVAAAGAAQQMPPPRRAIPQLGRHRPAALQLHKSTTAGGSQLPSQSQAAALPGAQPDAEDAIVDSDGEDAGAGDVLQPAEGGADSDVEDIGPPSPPAASAAAQPTKPSLRAAAPSKSAKNLNIKPDFSRAAMNKYHASNVQRIMTSVKIR